MRTIRKSEISDIEEIMQIYENAKDYMRKEGNFEQWINGYPSMEIILNDINLGNHYSVLDSESKIIAVFSFIMGEDPTYRYIENGEWLNNEPYGTIHRMASSGKESGILRECVNFCVRQCNCRNIRIDTHQRNQSMLRSISKLGFTKCGVIYIADGSPRLAFHKVIKKE